jgi:hypothetical protein
LPEKCSVSPKGLCPFILHRQEFYRSNTQHSITRALISLLGVDESVRSYLCCVGIDDLEVVGDCGRLADHC